ncbi:5052_t:CDS:2, partial [Funneliformis caledonium]
LERVGDEQPQESLRNQFRSYLHRMAMLWIHVENEPKPDKFYVMRQQSELDKIDLIDISPELCKRETLKDVKPHSLEFFRYGDRINSLPPGTLISTLATTDTDPLVVRYPVSDSQVVVRCNLSTSWYKERFPHSSGLWYLIRHKAEKKWETLSSDNSQYFFVYSQDRKKSEEEEIENEFALNKIVKKIQPPENSDERAINLTIRVEGKKAYGDWEIGEVLKKLLHQDGSSIGDVLTFKIDELKKPNPKIADEELKLIIDELKKKKCAFQYVVRNESTCREFISAFMTTAVKCVQLIEGNLQLKAEEWLDGSHGYGPTDYAVYVESIIALVAEAKKEDFEKGAAQNIVQMHSAVETLTRKRKIDKIDDGNVPVLMYGIVTNALQWYFIRWAGSSEDPTVEVSGPHECEFDSEDMEQAKKIAGYIVSILQHQVRGLNDENDRLKIKETSCIIICLPLIGDMKIF